MQSVDYLIIGGGIAGTTAAETIRQKDKNGSIALISGESHFLYSRVLLPEFIRGEADLDKIMLREARDYEKNGIDVFLDEFVDEFNPGRMILKTSRGKEFHAGKILIASGGRPKPWNFETLKPEMTFRLQTLNDAMKIKKFLSSRLAKNALVVGGGFMALEFIEILAKYGWKIKLLCAEKYFWPDYLDETGAGILSDLWKKNGIEIIYGDEVERLTVSEPSRFSKEAEVTAITKNGRKLAADFLGVGIGLERNSKFLDQTPFGPFGLIEVNERLETPLPSVWAAGDVASYEDSFSGRRRLGGNWSGAFMQGRIAGLNMAGVNEIFKTIPIYAITHLGLNIAFIGDAGPFKSDFGEECQVIYLNKEKNAYARIFSKNGRVIGAALINGQKFLGSINQAIMKGCNISKITLD